MATLTQLNTFSADLTFQGQSRAAMIKAALNILGEDTTGQSDTKIRKRQTLAHNVLSSKFRVETWALAICANIDSITPTEQQINDAVSAIWDDMAGLITGE